MTTTTPSLSHHTALPVILDDMRARQQTRIAALAQLGGERMTAACVWAAQDVDVRFMLLRVGDHEEEHMLHLVKTLGWIGHQPTETHQLLGAAQAARGDLLGALIGLDDDDIDRVPTDPEGEWSLRTTLSHVLQVERSYRLAVETDLALHRAGEPWHAHEMVTPESPVTSLADTYQRLAAYRSATMQSLHATQRAELTAHSVWFNVALSVRFRILRFAHHEREHAAHIRKWRRQVGLEEAEAQALLNLLARARGATEAVLVGVPDRVLDVDPGHGEWTVRQILQHIDDVQERLTQRMLSAT